MQTSQWLAQLQIIQVTLRVLEHQDLWPGTVSIKPRHKSPAVHSGICQQQPQLPWGQHRLQTLSSQNIQWPAMAKTRHAATALGWKSRQEERCSTKDRHMQSPHKTVRAWHAKPHCFLGRSLSQISIGKRWECTCWEQHTQKGLVSEKMSIVQWQLCCIL